MMMDSDSDFYGDEDTVSALKARVDDFDLAGWWENHDKFRILVPHADPDNLPIARRLHNSCEGLPGARQLTESVDEFLTRLPPATTDRNSDLPWIWIANPWIPPSDKTPDHKTLVGGGLERLRLFSEFIEKTNASGKTPFVIKRHISKEREAVIQDLRDLAVACNVLTGKWMLFPAPGLVNDVWGKIARATTNNELGITAKVETREIYEKERLICVYTADFRDKNDIARVLNRLRKLELVRQGGRQIYYKNDAWTELGIYGGNEWNIPASMYSSNEIFEYIKDHFPGR
ncbi:hypothetical protein QBC47DRAFT_386482 [Echria macrotheca]|uniref:DUF1917-domain-containing protein n=1 Tax=Echria macrotheca TaxID=438768 RepID=A0AAJ0B928_9PEZI|nr:hypothetical protein QBC47DRAFT_386482 [Echria macrotheca]